MAKSLPNWMKKFPPNYQIREIPGVRGVIHEEAYNEEEFSEELTLFFYLLKYRDDTVVDGKLVQMSHEEEAELKNKVDAWIKKNDVGSHEDVNWSSVGFSDTNYFAYLRCPAPIHETRIDYWGGQYPPDNLHTTLNWNWKQMQYLIRMVI